MSSLFDKIFRKNNKIIEDQSPSKYSLTKSDLIQFNELLNEPDPTQNNQSGDTDFKMNKRGKEIMRSKPKEEGYFSDEIAVPGGNSLVLANPTGFTWKNQEAYVYRVDSRSPHGQAGPDLEFVIYIPIDTAVHWLDADKGGKGGREGRQREDEQGGGGKKGGKGGTLSGDEERDRLKGIQDSDARNEGGKGRRSSDYDEEGRLGGKYDDNARNKGGKGRRLSGDDEKDRLKGRSSDYDEEGRLGGKYDDNARNKGGKGRRLSGDDEKDRLKGRPDGGDANKSLDKGKPDSTSKGKRKFGPEDSDGKMLSEKSDTKKKQHPDSSDESNDEGGKGKNKPGQNKEKNKTTTKKSDEDEKEEKKNKSKKSSGKNKTTEEYDTDEEGKTSRKKNKSKPSSQTKPGPLDTEESDTSWGPTETYLGRHKDRSNYKMPPHAVDFHHRVKRS